MIIQALIIALLVLSIHYTMLPGEIFGAIGSWFEKHLPSKVHPAVYECNVCMTFWYGSIIYWIVYAESILSWLIVVITAMGFNVLFNKWEPNDPQ